MTTDPFARPTPTKREQKAQRQARDRLVRAVIFAVDTFVIDHRDELQRVSRASVTRLIVQAAVGSLLGDGFIAEVDPAPEFFRPTLPEHLRPDLDEALAEYARIQAALP